jgi:putative transcriptional regulator
MTTTSWAGSLLVATPALGDPSFHRSVVLLLDHDEEGALGVVVNRPTEVDVGAVLPDWEAYAGVPGVVFHGGPVDLDSALALGAVRSALHGPTGLVVPGPAGSDLLGWRRVIGDLGLVDLDAPPELVVPALDRLRIFAGYAGWGSGQLEDEVSEGAWWVLPAEPQDAFADEPEDLWRAVLRRQPGGLALVSTYPDDPALN